jgi:hypothetical protein
MRRTRKAETGLIGGDHGNSGKRKLERDGARFRHGGVGRGKSVVAFGHVDREHGG